MFISFAIHLVLAKPMNFDRNPRFGKFLSHNRAHEKKCRRDVNVKSESSHCKRQQAPLDGYCPHLIPPHGSPGFCSPSAFRRDHELVIATSCAQRALRDCEWGGGQLRTTTSDCDARYPYLLLTLLFFYFTHPPIGTRRPCWPHTPHHTARKRRVSLR